MPHVTIKWLFVLPPTYASTGYNHQPQCQLPRIAAPACDRWYQSVMRRGNGTEQESGGWCLYQEKLKWLGESVRQLIYT